MAYFSGRGSAWTIVWVSSVLVARAVQADEVVFVDYGADWRYLRGLTEPSSPDPTAWRAAGFDDSGWSRGAAPFGYGRSGPFGTDLAETQPPMQNTYSSIALRRTFDIGAIEKLVELRLELFFDDGLLVWINGVEVYRSQVPGNPGDFVAFDAVADRSHSPTALEEIDIENAREILRSGENTIAVQVFNQSLRSTDLHFDIRVLDPFGPDRNPPVIAATFPPPGVTVRRLDTVSVTFSEAVTGVDATDLLLAGSPAAGLSGEAAGPYLFEFAPAPAGAAAITWAANHGIVDIAEEPNAFAAEGWSYTIDPNATRPAVVITEILAANGTNLTDADQENEDWIELQNQGGEPVSLAGWSLTDQEGSPLWVFPDVVLGAGEFLVVFASAKDRTDPAGELHTSFKLASAGEYLGLLAPELPPEPVSELAPRYPEQRYDVAYGRTAAGDVGYFAEPTPGAPNGEALLAGFVVDPFFSVERGFYDEAFDLELSSPTAGARIYYTLDGSPPDPATSTLYSDPLAIAGTPERGVVLVRAIAVADGLVPSRVVTHSYLFREQILLQPQDPPGFPPRWGSQVADYEMNQQVLDADRDLARAALTSIPTLSIVTRIEDLFDQATGVYSNPSRSGPLYEREVSAELIRADGEEGFQIDCGLRSQGGSSTSGWKSRKVSLRLLFKGDYGAAKLNYPLYPGYKVEEFNTLVIDAGLNLTLNHPDHAQRIRSQYVRDQYIADLQNEAGGYGPHAIFVNVYLNGVYWGMYWLHERADAAFASTIFGGARADYDAIRHQSTNVVDGSALTYQEMLAAARTARTSLDNYVLLGEQHLDLRNFADYMLINLWAGNTDWAHQNWYATKRREGGLFRYHSWDPEHVLKSAGENVLARNDSGGPTEVFQSLRQVEEFRLLFADRVHKHLMNGGMLYVDEDAPQWNPDAPEKNRAAAHYMRRIEEIRAAVLLEFARWGDNYRTPTYVYSDWERELDTLQRTYFPVRTRTVLNQFLAAGLYSRVGAPVFSQHGGDFAQGFQLSMTLPAPDEAATILYTLDGSDPRVFGTGDSARTARTYGGPIAIDDTVVVRARTLSGGAWSALTEAVFTAPGASPADLVISEIMYRPPLGATLEFVEVHNPTGVTISLAGVAFSNGVDFVFDEYSTIAPDEHLVIVADPLVFAAFHPDVEVAGAFSGNLAGEGEKLTLRGPGDLTIVSVEYDDDGFWPIAPDGFGHSLVLADPLRDPDDPRAWRASAEPAGSPGAADPAPRHGGVLLSEVRADAGRAGNAIELHNVTAGTIEVGGWFLSPTRADSARLAAYYRFPSPSAIPAGGYLVVPETAFNPEPRTPQGFALSDLGGALYLAAAEGGALSGYITGVEFDAAEPGVSFGVHETSQALELTALTTPTLGAANAPPRAAPVAINEVHYHPGGGQLEFVELYNPSNAAIDLEGWELGGLDNAQGTGDLVFPGGSVVPPRGYLLVVPIDPDDFRAAFDVPAEATVVGPFTGALQNEGERLRLWKPVDGAPHSRVLIDHVRYNDVAPWPEEANGGGRSLERVLAGEFGNEPRNWEASTVDGGTPGAINSVTPSGPVEGGLQRPGDLSQDGMLNLNDGLVFFNHLFDLTDRPLPCGDGSFGDAGNRSLLDANADRRVDLTDGVYLLNYLFLEGPMHVLGERCVEIDGCPEVCP